MTSESDGTVFHREICPRSTAMQCLSYTENYLLFGAEDFITFRLISSFRIIAREILDVYKETSE